MEGVLTKTKKKETSLLTQYIFLIVYWWNRSACFTEIYTMQTEDDVKKLI